MADLVRFVDSIAASPTVRLNVNDETTWWVKSFSAPPPRLRRSMSPNAMRDGVHVSASSYESRTITLELEVRTSTQDATATAMQTLWRELDRESNFLMYQPTGATKPVFFKLYRSDASQIEDVVGQSAMRQFTIDLLAEPFAEGLVETLGPYTVNNDPAAASNPCYFDVTGVIGDVPAPPLLRNTTAKRYQTIMAIRQRGTPANAPIAVQCETMGLAQDTTNPGGGPDEVMSGTGTNNFRQTSFASGTGYSVRLIYTMTTPTTDTLGRYVVYAALRRSDSTSVISVGAGRADLATPPATALPLSTSRILVRLGMLDLSSPAANPQGGTTIPTASVQLWASRTSGAGTLDWDCVFLLPADQAMLHATGEGGGIPTDSENWFDSSNETAIIVQDASSPTGIALQVHAPMQTSGGFLSLAPNQTNRIWWLAMSDLPIPVHTKTIADSISVSYRPRYLYIRPSAS